MNKTTIEYLDFVLSKITDISNFIVWNILKTESTDFDFDNATEDDKHLMLDESRKVADLGITYGYFIKISHAEFRLTDKGIKAKELGGHLKYQKSAKKTPLNTYQKIYLPFFILFGLLGIYKVFQPTVPVSDFHKLKTDFDTLNSRFDSIVKSTSKPTLELLNDTSQTKNFRDLKND
ncbi:hypothetical protein [Gelidibacter japonicus]|uniref:hypothetical protein n=1 Tax=Gelidibacter japonicus TaxID=1962232 RepID=UPI002AFEAB8D|nr:hypothetical protein [Gelidibacter japonicus]